MTQKVRVKSKIIFICFLLIASEVFSQNIKFNAKGLVFLSDADMSAYSLIDGNLRKNTGAKDAISTLSFPLNYNEPDQIKNDNASNSIINGAKNICFSTDQKLAYVLETKGETALHDEEFSDVFSDFPSGKFITVVDISNLKKPKSLYRFEVGRNPKSISIDPQNHYLAVSSEEYGKEIELYELDSSGKPIGLIKKPAGLSPGKIADLKWHAGGDFLVYLNQDEGTVGVIRIVRDKPTQKIIRMEVFGQPVKIGGLISKGSFSPDGKYFIVLNKHKELSDLEDQTKGEVFVIKLNLDSPVGTHYLISRAAVGENPVSFDIHPSGNYVVVNNMERSFIPPDNYLKTGESSLSILSLGLDGTLQNIKNYSIEGILPASAIFDKNGENIAYSVFQYLTFGYSFGGIQFLTFNPKTKEILEMQKGKIYVPRGIHGLKSVFEY